MWTVWGWRLIIQIMFRRYVFVIQILFLSGKELLKLGKMLQKRRIWKQGALLHARNFALTETIYNLKLAGKPMQTLCIYFHICSSMPHIFFSFAAAFDEHLWMHRCNKKLLNQSEYVKKNLKMIAVGKEWMLVSPIPAIYWAPGLSKPCNFIPGPSWMLMENTGTETIGQNHMKPSPILASHQAPNTTFQQYLPVAFLADQQRSHEPTSELLLQVPE